MKAGEKTARHEKLILRLHRLGLNGVMQAPFFAMGQKSSASAIFAMQTHLSQKKAA